MSQQESLNEAVFPNRTASERVAEANDYREGKQMGTRIVGSPVISIDRGEEVGRVHDVIFSAENGRLVGVTIKIKGGLFRGGKTLLIRSERMHSIGEDAITVQTSEAIEEIDKSVSDFAKEVGESVIGKRLMTEDGDFLGKIDDVLIDRQLKQIAACKVSGGIWNDLMRGQTDIPIEQILSIGSDVVIVPSSVKPQIEEVTGGLIGTVQITGEKIVDAKEVVVEKTAEAVETAGEKIAQARTIAAEKIEDKEVDFALGKVAGSDVLTDEGNIIVRQGETVTEAHIQHALATKRMHALAAAAGKAQATELYDSAKDKTASGVESAKEKLAAGLETLKDKAEDAQETFKDKQSDLLIGKTVGRDVTTDDGSVVVRGGTTITEIDVANARARGLLGDLTAAAGMQALASAKDVAAEKYEDASQRLTDGRSEQSPSLPLESNTTIIHTDKVIIAPETAVAPLHPASPDLKGE